MSAATSACAFTAYTPQTFEIAEPSQWYAIHVRARHEKKVADELRGRGIEVLLPLQAQKTRWSDRWKVIEKPLFPCYVFLNAPLVREVRLSVLRLYGALSIVGTHSGPLPIPQREIEAVRRVLAQELTVSSHPYCSVGQRIRVRGGALDGLEGILTEADGEKRMVLSIQTVQRSVSVSINGYEIEPA
ncbi:MAG TPA: UpxY family transcription antiterminator [Terriglobales bacterium]|nr:UpxY family transcription antiterminator [Terriglobales bacterium]